MAGQHGFARTLKWEAMRLAEHSCTLRLEHSDVTMKAWPHKFTLLYKVSHQNDGLHVKLKVINCDDHSFSFTALLHTYFNIGSIDSVSIIGLNGLEYADKLKNNEKFIEKRQIIDNINGEVDRNYFNVPAAIKLSCSNGEFQIQSNFKDLGKHANKDLSVILFICSRLESLD